VIQRSKPKAIVELGTDVGTSFFAICHVVRLSHLDSHLVTADTWIGQERSGRYDDEVALAKDVITREFASAELTLSRCAFDEVLSRIDDASVDSMHIEGYNHYEAVGYHCHDRNCSI
jgi:hypothetical protein